MVLRRMWAAMVVEAHEGAQEGQAEQRVELGVTVVFAVGAVDLEGREDAPAAVAVAGTAVVGSEVAVEVVVWVAMKEEAVMEVDVLAA